MDPTVARSCEFGEQRNCEARVHRVSTCPEPQTLLQRAAWKRGICASLLPTESRRRGEVGAACGFSPEIRHDQATQTINGLTPPLLEAAPNQEASHPTP